jgi:hypothetical protein
LCLPNDLSVREMIVRVREIIMRVREMIHFSMRERLQSTRRSERDHSARWGR